MKFWKTAILSFGSSQTSSQNKKATVEPFVKVKYKQKICGAANFVVY